MVGQLGRAVKAIDSKSIGVTRVSSSLTAVELFKAALRAGGSRYGCLSFCSVVILSHCHLVVCSFVYPGRWYGRWVLLSFVPFGFPTFGHAAVSFSVGRFCLLVFWKACYWYRAICCVPADNG